LLTFVEKTQQELQDGDMKWAFWAKLIVVGVGFTGGLVFMYVQVRKAYMFKKKMCSSVVFMWISYADLKMKTKLSTSSPCRPRP
jgi:hypothetical protein